MSARTLVRALPSARSRARPHRHAARSSSLYVVVVPPRPGRDGLRQRDPRDPAAGGRHAASSTGRTACSPSRRRSVRPSSARRSGSALFAVALSLPLVLNAGGFAVAALLVLTLRGQLPPGARRAAPARSARDIADGVRWLVRHRFLRGLTAVSAATALRAEHGHRRAGALRARGAAPAGRRLRPRPARRRAPAACSAVLTAAALARRFGRGPVLVVGGVLTGVTTSRWG